MNSERTTRATKARSGPVVSPILVVEDDEGLNRLLLKRLKNAGYEAVGVFSGRDAIAAAGKNPDALMLLDYKLPDMTGQEVVKRLADAGRAVPFIIMTGFGDEETVVNMMNLGACDYVIKDAGFVEKLPAVIRRILREVDSEQELANAQRALRESEEKWRSLVEHAPNIILVVDRQGTIEFINHVVPGLRKEDIIGSNQYDYIAPQHRETVEKTIEHVFQTGESARYETAGTGPDGSQSWYETQVGAIKDNGQVVAALLITTDITGRKRAEEGLIESERRLKAANQQLVASEQQLRAGNQHSTANQQQLRAANQQLAASEQQLRAANQQLEASQQDLRATNRNLIANQVKLENSEARYRTVFNGSGDGILIADIETRRFLLANPSLCRFLGYELAEIPSLGVQDIHPKDSLPHVIAEFEAQARGEKVVAAEIPCLRKDGSVVYADISTTMMMLNGRPCNVGFFRDVSERRKAQESIRSERDRAQRYLDIAGVMFVALDTQGTVTLVNGKTCEILGYDESEIVGKNWFENFVPRDTAALVRPVSEKLLAGEVERAAYFENPVLTRDGRTPLIAWHDTVLRDDQGRVSGHLSSGEDITERRRAELREREHAQHMAFLARTATALVELPPEADIHRFIAERLREIVPEPAIIAVSDLEAATNRFRPRSILGIDKLLAGIRKVIGRDPLEISSDYSEEVKSAFGSGRLREIKGRLAEFAPGAFPRAASMAIEKMLGIRGFYVIGFMREGRMIGGLSIVLRHGATIPEASLIEAFAGQAAVALERRRAEEALRSSEANLKDAQSLGHIGNWEYSPADGTMAWSDEVYRIYERDPALGPPSAEQEAAYYSPQHAKTLAQLAQKCISSGQQQACDTKARLPGGTLKHLHTTMRPVRNGAGKVLKLFGTVQDITERRRAEQLLRDKEEQFRDLFENASDLIQAVKPDGSFFYVNRAWREVLGYSEQEAAGLHVFDIVHPDSLEHCRQLFEKVMAGNNVDFVEAAFVSKQGRRIEVEGSVSCRYQDGEPVSTRGIFHDVTQRKRAEEDKVGLEEKYRQAQKMEAIGQLAGGVAHDFNNALGGIMGYADLLKIHLRDNPKLRKYADKIAESVNRAAALTRQLLAFARKGRLEVGPVNMHDIIRDTDDILRQTLDRRIRIEIDLTAKPSIVRGDASQLANVLLNLAINARDAMPQGGVLTFETRSVTLTHDSFRGEVFDAVPGPYVRASVIDTGVGMDDATKARLFEPFFTTKQVGKGTGLGLASVYGTVKQLDGFITVQTQLGKGSRFDVFLPEWDAARAQAVARPSESVKGSGRVMVVDDEESIRETAAEGLTTLGYEPVCFSDPIEAIEYYRANHGEIAIVLLDLMMPNMSGLDCFRALKNIAPAVRAVIVSGYSEDGEAGRIMEEGARIFVEKPFKIEELSRAVARAMGKEA